MDMDISTDIHVKSMDMDMNVKFYIHGNSGEIPDRSLSRFRNDRQSRKS